NGRPAPVRPLLDEMAEGHRIDRIRRGENDVATFGVFGSGHDEGLHRERLVRTRRRRQIQTLEAITQRRNIQPVDYVAHIFIGALHDERLAANESSSTRALRRARGAPATGKTSICSVALLTSVELSPAAFAVRS